MPEQGAGYPILEQQEEHHGRWQHPQESSAGRRTDQHVERPRARTRGSDQRDPQCHERQRSRQRHRDHGPAVQQRRAIPVAHRYHRSNQRDHDSRDRGPGPSLGSGQEQRSTCQDETGRRDRRHAPDGRLSEHPGGAEEPVVELQVVTDREADQSPARQEDAECRRRHDAAADGTALGQGLTNQHRASQQGEQQSGVGSHRDVTLSQGRELAPTGHPSHEGQRSRACHDGPTDQDDPAKNAPGNGPQASVTFGHTSDPKANGRSVDRRIPCFSASIGGSTVPQVALHGHSWVSTHGKAG